MIQLWKEGDPVTCCDTDVIGGGHYAKQNKPDTERKILHLNTHIPI
jgi:hypothetical protein